jgi:hypothetical protein
MRQVRVEKRNWRASNQCTLGIYPFFDQAIGLEKRCMCCKSAPQLNQGDVKDRDCRSNQTKEESPVTSGRFTVKHLKHHGTLRKVERKTFKTGEAGSLSFCVKYNKQFFDAIQLMGVSPAFQNSR